MSVKQAVICNIITDRFSKNKKKTLLPIDTPHQFLSMRNFIVVKTHKTFFFFAYWMVFQLINIYNKFANDII